MSAFILHTCSDLLLTHSYNRRIGFEEEYFASLSELLCWKWEIIQLEGFGSEKGHAKT